MKKIISVVISAFNEEEKIKDALESVLWADEIIVVDNSSTDDTSRIAKKYTKHVFVKENNPMLNVNKNFGFQKATGDWILSLDADERITDELAREIKEKTGSEDEVVGYWIPRKNIIFGKWMEHSGWYPDLQLRFFKRGKGKFAEEHVHEMITLQGESGELTHSIVHYNYDSISQFVKKMSLYAPNEADQLIKKGYKFRWQDALLFPFNEFLSRFFAREGYKDGFHGLVMALGMSFYHFIVFALIWERNGFVKIEDEDILDGVKKEFKKIGNDTLHWVSATGKNDLVITVKKAIDKYFK
jgi:(heptosyl)LPS beta-1,4-glucosyltransferase